MPLRITKPKSSWSASCTWASFTIRHGARCGRFCQQSLCGSWCGPHAQRNGPLLEVVRPLARRFVVVGPHHERLLDHTAGVEARADADDRTLHGTFLQNTALAEHGFAHVRLEQLRGQVARPRVDRCLFIIEAEGGHRLRSQRQIGVVKCLNRPDIFPIILEQIRLHIVRARRGREDIFAKIRVRRLWVKRSWSTCLANT